MLLLFTFLKLAILS